MATHGLHGWIALIDVADARAACSRHELYIAENWCVAYCITPGTSVGVAECRVCQALLAAYWRDWVQDPRMSRCEVPASGLPNAASSSAASYQM
jgi:hypothetical protein